MKRYLLAALAALALAAPAIACDGGSGGSGGNPPGHATSSACDSSNC